jgi:hypothetical protein
MLISKLRSEHDEDKADSCKNLIKQALNKVLMGKNGTGFMRINLEATFISPILKGNIILRVVLTGTIRLYLYINDLYWCKIVA